MPDTIAIVGAGASGAACAQALAGLARTVVVERRPGPDADVRATAIRWDGRALLAVGAAGPVEIAAAALVVATGAHPLGRAELGLAGTRPNGVLPAPAACELAEHGLFRPSRPVVIGGGRWAARATAALAEMGAAVTVVAPEGLLVAMETAIAVHERLTPLAVRGDPQVERLECEGAAFECDGIVLAHGLVPVRNVDGAVCRGERTVYAQPTADPPSGAASQTAGEDAARGALAITAGAATIGPWSSSPNSPPSV
jgi:Pyridine nucleotide-disulphide oxidoreductase